MAIGGAITAYADALALATAGRVLAGAGAVLFNVLSAAIVANWFIDKEMTLAMAIHVNSRPVLPWGLSRKRCALLFLGLLRNAELHIRARQRTA